MTPERQQLLDAVFASACTAAGCTLEHLRGPSRQAHLVAARAQVARELRASTTLTLHEIGWLLGGRDHTTVINLLRPRGKPRRGDPPQPAPAPAPEPPPILTATILADSPASLVVACVAACFGLQPGDLTSARRTANHVQARAAAAHLLRRAGLGMAEIGTLLGNRCRVTVSGMLHGKSRFDPTRSDR